MSNGGNRWEKKIIGLSIILLAVTLIAQFASAYFMPSGAVMHLAGERFEIRIADNQKTRRQGLSGTTDLPAGQAMLFIFDYSSKWSIWMKDMNYSIDIVWLDESKKVVDYATDVSPDTYPTKTFSPKEPALYVVELRSGTVKEKGIRVGQEAVFSGTSREL